MGQPKFGLAAALLISCLGSSSAFSIKPGAMVLQTKADQSVKGVFEVINDTGTELKIRVQMRDSHVIPENRNIHVADWLKPQFTELIIPPLSSKKAAFVAHPPKTAKGELAGFISFVPQVPPAPPAKGNEVQTRVVPVITVSCYVWIKGTERGEADLGETHVANLPPQGVDPAQIQATAVVKNLGNIHLRPGVLFEIFKKGDSAPLHRLEVPAGWPVLPGSENPYQARIEGKLPAGAYRLHTHVTLTSKASLDKNTEFSIDAAGQASAFHDLP